eukprot:scaffold329022_cov31-Attheya_sp.AAC.1
MYHRAPSAVSILGLRSRGCWWEIKRPRDLQTFVVAPSVTGNPIARLLLGNKATKRLADFCGGTKRDWESDRQGYIRHPPSCINQSSAGPVLGYELCEGFARSFGFTMGQNE